MDIRHKYVLLTDHNILEQNHIWQNLRDRQNQHVAITFLDLQQTEQYTQQILYLDSLNLKMKML